MGDAFILRDWNADEFHRRVLAYERQGYIARRDTYRIIPEVNPESGEVMHLHTIELILPEVNLPDPLTDGSCLSSDSGAKPRK